MTEGMCERVALIAGPTASGKSALALALARAVGGEIVNADALQVHADLDILSARPSRDEMGEVPHHLFGFLDGSERCSAGRWSREAARVVAEITGRGRIAVIVGGTGLYFRALEEGLSPIPPIPEHVRTEARDAFDRLGPEAFRATLLAHDPLAARIAPTDPQRMLRAFEVQLATGRPLSEFHSEKAPLIAPPVARVVIEPERKALYAACDARFDRMIEAGALGEASGLRDRRLSPDLPVMKALGAAELIAHLGGALTLDAAIDLAKRNTRRFVKRQSTWFRNQTADWPRTSSPQEALAGLLDGLQTGGVVQA